MALISDQRNFSDAGLALYPRLPLLSPASGHCSLGTPSPTRNVKLASVQNLLLCTYLYALWFMETTGTAVCIQQNSG